MDRTTFVQNLKRRAQETNLSNDWHNDLTNGASDKLYNSPRNANGVRWNINLKGWSSSAPYFTVFIENSGRIRPERLFHKMQQYCNNSTYTPNLEVPGSRLGNGGSTGVIVKLSLVDDTEYTQERWRQFFSGEMDDNDEEKNEILDKILKTIDNLIKIMKKILETPIKFSYNLIYFGAPGTGKSFDLNMNKDELLENQPAPEKHYERVTFYANYSYSQFVGTYKPVVPDNQITYEFVPGPFLRMLVKALKNQTNKYLLIVEEINRANAAAVFGDMFQLLDRNEEGISEYPVATSEDVKKYLESEGVTNSEQLWLPGNFYIWATMNSADQGVFPLDTAFKRRWDFKYFSVDDKNSNTNMEIKAGSNVRLKWNEVRKAINDLLLKHNVNEDKLLGPWFVKDDVVSCDLFVNKVLMYLWEDAARMCRQKVFANGITSFSKLGELWRKIELEVASGKCSLKTVFNFENKFNVASGQGDNEDTSDENSDDQPDSNPAAENG